MSKLRTAVKRILVGRPQRSDRLAHTLLRKRIALPVFASDAMSSVAYAPEEIFLTLSAAGLTAYVFSPWVGLAIVIVLLTVVASYRQNVHAYPSGGGDYEVATVNLGRRAGLTVASALLVDYTLTVAVSISAAAANIGALIPLVAEHKVTFAVVAIVLLTAVNLRGVRESGVAFAIPTYAFMLGIGTMIIWGLTRSLLLGDEVRAASADFDLLAEGDGFTGLALMLLVLRSFTQGCAALTGVEAISNGVPAFRKPKSRNAATTLLLLGGISVLMFSGLIVLAQVTGVRIAAFPERQLIGAPDSYVQQTLVAQLADAVFRDFRPGFFFVVVVTALILVLAANTAYNGFPVLGSILSQDRYLPRQLHTRGDRLAFSNGILVLASIAIVLVIGFRAEVTRLIALYTVGVFTSFTLSQIGMLRHWKRLLAVETNPAERRRMRRSQAINGFGAGDDRCGAGDRADHQVHQGSLDRDRRDGGVLRAHAGHPEALRPGGGRAGGRRVRRGAALAQPRRRPGLHAAQTDPACGGLRQGDPARRARGDHRQRRRRRHEEADAGLGEAQDPGAVEGHRVALPGDHPAGSGLREADQDGQPARRGHRVHPGVRRGSLVGADPAQPERPAAQGQVAVHSGGDGDERAVAAGIVGPGGAPRPGDGAGFGAPRLRVRSAAGVAAGAEVPRRPGAGRS